MKTGRSAPRFVWGDEAPVQSIHQRALATRTRVLRTADGLVALLRDEATTVFLATRVPLDLDA